YANEVARRVGWEEAMRILAKLHADMAPAVKEQLPKLGITGNDARAGAKLIEAVFTHHTPGLLDLMTRRWAEDTPQRVVFHHSGYCASMEACKAIGRTPREFCTIPHEEGLTPLVQAINPALRVRLGKMRPESEYCEVIIEQRTAG
ncbi:MAG: hypothetical protein AB1603_08480, partial [Chloroflexota bacterium]